MIHFLVHDTADKVGVAVVDIEPGTHCAGRSLNQQATEAKSAQEFRWATNWRSRILPWATR